MTTIVTERMGLRIPNWVRDLQSFRRWVHDLTFPEKLPAWWIHGEVWIDICRQEIFKHVQLRGAIYSGLLNRAAVDDSGYFFSSGIFFSNAKADLAGNPDGLFVSFETMKS